MNPDSPLRIQALEKFAVFMTKEKVAEALGIGTHNIPLLMRAGLLKPLGHPQCYCVKKFSRETLARNIADETWLDKVAAGDSPALAHPKRAQAGAAGAIEWATGGANEIKWASPLRSCDRRLGEL